MSGLFRNPDSSPSMSAFVASPLVSPTLPQPPLPPDTRRPVRWGCLHGTSVALLIAAAATRYRGLVLVVAPDSQTALRLAEQKVEQVLERNGGDVEILPFGEMVD